MEFSKSELMDIVYGFEPMTKTLAEKIRELRCENKTSYELIPYHVNAGFGRDFTLGRQLCQKAKTFLKGEGNNWD